MDVARKIEVSQLFLDIVFQFVELLVELGTVRTLGLVLDFSLGILDLGAQRFELLDRSEQLLELFFVGLGTALLFRIARGLLVFLEYSAFAEIGFAGLDAIAYLDQKIERYRRAQNLVLDFEFTGLDALGNLDLLLTREQLEVAHLLEIQAYRVGGLAQRIGDRGSLSGLFGLFLDVGITLVFGARGRDLVEDLDIHVLEAFEGGAQIGGRGNILRQKVVDLVESQVTLLASEVDEPL